MTAEPGASLHISAHTVPASPISSTSTDRAFAFPSRRTTSASSARSSRHSDSGVTVAALMSPAPSSQKCSPPPHTGLEFQSGHSTRPGADGQVNPP